MRRLDVIVKKAQLYNNLGIAQSDGGNGTKRKELSQVDTFDCLSPTLLNFLIQSLDLQYIAILII